MDNTTLLLIGAGLFLLTRKPGQTKPEEPASSVGDPYPWDQVDNPYPFNPYPTPAPYPGGLGAPIVAPKAPRIGFEPIRTSALAAPNKVRYQMYGYDPVTAVDRAVTPYQLAAAGRLGY